MRSFVAALSTPFCLVASRSLTEAREHVLHTHQGNAASIGEGGVDIQSMCWVVTARVKSEARLGSFDRASPTSSTFPCCWTFLAVGGVLRRLVGTD